MPIDNWRPLSEFPNAMLLVWVFATPYGHARVSMCLDCLIPTWGGAGQSKVALVLWKRLLYPITSRDCELFACYGETLDGTMQTQVERPDDGPGRLGRQRALAPVGRPECPPAARGQLDLGLGP